MSTQFPSNSPQRVVGVAVKTADYNVALLDAGWLLVMNSASAHTFTLLATPPARNGWFVLFQNVGAGTCTISRNGNNIDGAPADISLPQGAGVLIASDGSTYYTERGLPSGVELTANKDVANGYAGLDANAMLKLAEMATAVDARTTTSEAVSNSDRGKIVTFSNASAIAGTIAQAGAGGNFIAGWWCRLLNLGPGALTLTPATSTINGNSTLVLGKNQGVIIISDGANYVAIGTILGDQTSSPTDGYVLSYDGTNHKWIAVSPGSLSGISAVQLRGVNIAASAATPNNYEVLRYSSADAAWDNVLEDGMEHGDIVWWIDCAFNELRDDFMTYSGTTIIASSATTNIGELNWVFLGSGSQRFYGGAPPYLGQFAWSNPSTSGGSYGLILLNSISGYTQYSHSAWSLLDNPGWRATWVFQLAGNENQSGTSNSNGLPYKKSLYVGFCGNNIFALKDASATLFSPRPDVFLGLRYDTSTSPAGFCISSVDAASGGNTTYHLAYTYSTLTSALNGISVNIKGCGNAANNGTFTIQSVTTTTIVVNNASGVAESQFSSPINTGSGRINLAAMPLTAVTQNSPTTGQATYTMLDVTTGQSNTTYGHGTNGAYIGQSVAIAGFTNGGNNGTFVIIGSTATTIIVANASAVTETHNGTATPSNGNCDDTNFQFEVVMNNTYQNACRHNAQGTVVDTGITPQQNTWYRLDMRMTVSGTVVMTLTDSNGSTATHTFSSIAQMDLTKAFSGITYGSSANKYASLGLAAPTSSSSGVPTVAKVNLGGGSQVTISGLAGAVGTRWNGTWTLEDYVDGGAQGSGGTATFFIGTANVADGAQTPTSVLAYPALTPIFCFGNDDCFGASSQGQTWYQDFAVDFFGLAWNKAIASPSTAPNSTKVRYW